MARHSNSAPPTVSSVVGFATACAAAASVTGTLCLWRIVGQLRTYGTAEPYEAASVVLAAVTAAGGLWVRSAARSQPQRFATADFISKPVFLRMVLYLTITLYLASAFSRTEAIVGRFLLHQLLGLSLVVAVLAASPALSRSAFLRRMAQRWRLLDLPLFGVVTTCLLLELCLRAWLGFGTPPSWLRYGNAAYAFKYPASGQADTPPNADGYVDLPFSEPKPPKTFRIAAIGDSFNAGNVAYEHNWLTLAESQLDASLPNASAYTHAEIYNLGINNNSPVEYLQVLQEVALGYRPDLVTCSFYVGNDVSFGRTQPHPLYKDALRTYHVLSRVAVVLRELSSRSGTVGEVLGVATPEAAGAFKMSERRYLAQQQRHLRLCNRLRRPVADERKWEAALAAVGEMATVCRAHGVRFVLIICPDAYQTDPGVLAMTLQADQKFPEHFSPLTPNDFDLSLPQQRIRTYAMQNNIPCVDLLPRFQEATAAGSGPFFLERNHHWNIAGNALAAQELVEQLAPFVVANNEDTVPQQR